VSFDTVTLCVASQRVFIVVNCIFRYRLSAENLVYTVVCVRNGRVLYKMRYKNYFHEVTVTVLVISCFMHRENCLCYKSKLRMPHFETHSSSAQWRHVKNGSPEDFTRSATEEQSLLVIYFTAAK